MNENFENNGALVRGKGAALDRTPFQPWPAKPSGVTKGKDSSLLKPALAAGLASAHMPEVVLYEHIDFGGAEWRTNLSYSYVGDFWNDRVSSIIVVSGTWRFYEHADFQGRYWDLSPGYYHWVEEAGVINDMISSFQAIAL